MHEVVGRAAKKRMSARRGGDTVRRADGAILPGLGASCRRESADAAKDSERFPAKAGARQILAPAGRRRFVEAWNTPSVSRKYLREQRQGAAEKQSVRFRYHTVLEVVPTRQTGGSPDFIAP